MRFFTILLCFISYCTGSYSQPNVIFDTDIGSDCDDAGAMAVLHKLADKGELNILGVIFSSNKFKYGVGVCDAINTYYGRGDLPLGQSRGNNIGDPVSSYARDVAISREYGHKVVDSARELLSVYKHILKNQPDSSVTIITVGHTYGVYTLLNDSIGRRLVRSKVKRWIAMTQTSDSAVRDWNFTRNGTDTYTAELLKRWPTEMYFTGAGKFILTGNKKLPSTPRNNPVRRVYELWGTNALVNGRSSWDQIAVLFAARAAYFGIDTHGSLEMNARSETYWNWKADHPLHNRVVPIISDSMMTSVIEDLMAEMPSAGRQPKKSKTSITP